jgi:hypothetical protein
VIHDLILDMVFGGEPFWDDLHSRLLAADHGRGDCHGRAWRRTRIAQLLAEGWGEQAIADDVGCSVRVVGRDVALIRRVLRPPDDLEAAA